MADDIFGISIETILLGVKNFLVQFEKVIVALFYLIGIIFAVRTFMLLKQYGESRSMSGGQMTLRKPILTFIVAVVLLYAPGMIDAFIFTIYPASYYDYTITQGSSGEYDLIIFVASRIMQVIGYIAFLRGWILLVRIGEQGAPPGALAKSLLHIIAGVLAINIVGTFSLLGAIIGL